MESLSASDPREVGRYRLLGRLGSGGMGRVYLGRSPGGRPVAVKVIHPSIASHPSFRVRFEREVEAARRVGGFHTAQVVDVDAAADPPWMVSAYVPGPSLRDAVLEHGPLPAETVLALGAGLAEGLSAVHECGLVHRDLKPGNVVIAADGPRIIDFGIAHAVDGSAVTASGAVVGTPAYMSPEQARGEKEIGPASDVFSFGSVLAFAATGTSPFEAGSMAAAVYRILHEEPDLSGVPEQLRDLVAACLSKEPERRPDVAALLERLGSGGDGGAWLPAPVASMVAERSAQFPDVSAEPAASSGTPVPSTEPGRGAGAPRPQRSKGRLAALVGVPVLLVALLAGGGGWFIVKGESDDEARGDVAAGGGVAVGDAPPISAAVSPPASPSEKSPSPRRTVPESGPTRKRATSRPTLVAPASCREGYAEVARANVMIQPCMRVAGAAGLTAFLRVKPMTAAGTGGPVSVWVWISSEANTKYRATLKQCRVSFDALEDEAVCGPVTFRPPQAGNYYTAGDAAAEAQELPPRWPIQFTGVTGDLIHWKP